MATESSRVALRLANDPRHLGAVSAAVEHFAQRVGFDVAEQRELVAAAQQACLDTFKLLPGEDGRLGVVVQDFPDRLEITLEHEGEPLPSAGLETFAGLGGGAAGLLLLQRVDRILYATQAGLSRMTLVKYLGRPADVG